MCRRAIREALVEEGDQEIAESATSEMDVLVLLRGGCAHGRAGRTGGGAGAAGRPAGPPGAALFIGVCCAGPGQRRAFLVLLLRGGCVCGRAGGKQGLLCSRNAMAQRCSKLEGAS